MTLAFRWSAWLLAALTATVCLGCGGLSAEDAVLVRDIQSQNKAFLLEGPDAGTPGRVLVPTALLKGNYCGATRVLERHGESAEDAGIACPKGR